MSVRLVTVQSQVKLLPLVAQVIKTKPQDICQFKNAFDFAILTHLMTLPKLGSNLLVHRDRNRKRIKRKSKKHKYYMRSTRKRGGNRHDNDIVTYLLELLSTVGSFDNRYGTCAVNTLAVIRGINSSQYEELFYAFASKMNANYMVGLSSLQMAKALLSDENVNLTSHFFEYENTTDDAIQPSQCVNILEQFLLQINKERNKINVPILTFFSFSFKRINGHAAAVWFTSKKNIIIIDIQKSVSPKNIVLYCKMTEAENLPNNIQIHNDLFTILPIEDYITSEMDLKPGFMLSVFKSAYAQVDRFFVDESTVIGKNLNKLIKEQNELPRETRENFGKLEIPRTISFFLKDIQRLYDEESRLCDLIMRRLFEMEEVKEDKLYTDAINYLNKYKIYVTRVSREVNKKLLKLRDKLRLSVHKIGQPDLDENLLNCLKLNKQIHDLEIYVAQLKEDQRNINRSDEDPVNLVLTNFQRKKMREIEEKRRAEEEDVVEIL